jgi:methylated-DNA-[protein]-cysteine S-methyltransferase
MLALHLNQIESPLGKLLLVTDEEHRVRALEFSDHRVRLNRLLKEHYGQYTLAEVSPDEAAKSIIGKLERYFHGELTVVDDIPVVTHGNEFEEQVWAALKQIPAGQVVTYGQLAKQLGHTDPRKAVDVGAAVGANPAQVFVACHRVIGANGDLKGYAGGRHRKEWLLSHENATIPTPKKRAKGSEAAAQADAGDGQTANLPGF